jgi:hypothetical protein
MRPPRPVPETADAAIPSSAIILRAAGSAVAPSPSRCGVAADAAGRAGVALASGVAGAIVVEDAAAPAVDDAAALPSVSMTAITSFDVTVEPSGRVISVSTPSPGAGSSSTTLSVSMSIRFSSRLTGSPAFLCQLTSVASATDSGNWGTLTSILIGPRSLSPVSEVELSPAGAHEALQHRGHSSRDHHLAGFERRRERLLDQLLLLGLMLRRIADRR